MTWKKFAKSARGDIDKRLKLLRKIQKMFDKTDSFGDLSVAEWKGIAGVLGECEAEGARLNGFDWGWFGSMRAAGNFTKLIGRRDPTLAKALDIIPICGPVTQKQFEEYVSAFGFAFTGLDENSGSKGSKGLGSATRLLAMKRPDVFVCVNGGNQAGLEKALPDAKVTVKLDNYWEKVIQPIQQAPCLPRYALSAVTGGSFGTRESPCLMPSIISISEFNGEFSNQVRVIIFFIQAL